MWSPCRPQFEDWRYDPDLSLQDRDEIYWDEQPVPGGKRKAPEKENVTVDMDYLSRKLRRPKIETQEEVTQRMRAVELAVKEALAARGEKCFTDQEFPPTNQSLFVDPDHPPAKLQARILSKAVCYSIFHHHTNFCIMLPNIFRYLCTPTVEN